MPWTPLSARLPQLPLILAGPVLRRTEPDTVTVWLALREACEVSLEIYATAAGEGRIPERQLLHGARSTVPVGEQLHIVAVTARSRAGEILEPGQVYVYDLTFQRSDVTAPQQWSLQQALTSEAVPEAPISYFDHQLPSFCLPPADLNQVRLVHGSCRKAHGGDRDALPILDDVLAQHCTIASARPQQLFLTGDQVYGDEVADPLLLSLTDAGDTLLGWLETLPESLDAPAFHLSPHHLAPGYRSRVAEESAGLTAGLYDQPECAKSHLLGFGEYCAIYLFCWSPVLWSDLPTAQQVGREGKAAKSWTQELETIQGFANTLWKVRRSLSNIATYMIFDDHDVTDDWYLNQEWCLRVLSKPLGRRSVQNGMLAYALFQGWGNRPQDFTSGSLGESLLHAAKVWTVSQGTDTVAEAAIARYLGLPDRDPSGAPRFRLDGQVLILDRPPEALEWNYVVWGPCYEVIVLDTRTWRGYPADQPTNAPPMLLSPTAFERQLRQPLHRSAQESSRRSRLEATLVVAPTNLVSLEAIDLVQHWNLKQGKTFHNDVGDAWNINKHAFAELLNTLFEQRDRIIVLSGDIHYGSTVCLHHWSRSADQQADEIPHVLVQLTSSAIKNAELKTRVVHTKVKSLVAERPQDWAGWSQPVELLKVQSWLGFRRTKALPPASHLPIVQRLHPRRRTNWDIAVRQSHTPPDWRYHIEWMQRQPAQPVTRRPALTPASHRPLQQLKHWLVQHFWNNRWLQEGNEVVGLNNIGLVQFNWSSATNTHIVLHDLLWYAPWQPGMMVFSRYQAELDLQTAPPPIRILHSHER